MTNIHDIQYETAELASKAGIRRCKHHIYVNIPCPECRLENIEARIDQLESYSKFESYVPSLWRKFRRWTGW